MYSLTVGPKRNLVMYSNNNNLVQFDFENSRTFGWKFYHPKVSNSSDNDASVTSLAPKSSVINCRVCWIELNTCLRTELSPS
jgi:hypothetical protein